MAKPKAKTADQEARQERDGARQAAGQGGRQARGRGGASPPRRNRWSLPPPSRPPPPSAAPPPRPRRLRGGHHRARPRARAAAISWPPRCRPSGELARIGLTFGGQALKQALRRLLSPDQTRWRPGAQLPLPSRVIGFSPVARDRSGGRRGRRARSARVEVERQDQRQAAVRARLGARLAELAQRADLVVDVQPRTAGRLLGFVRGIPRTTTRRPWRLVNLPPCSWARQASSLAFFPLAGVVLAAAGLAHLQAFVDAITRRPRRAGRQHYDRAMEPSCCCRPRPRRRPRPRARRQQHQRTLKSAARRAGRTRRGGAELMSVVVCGIDVGARAADGIGRSATLPSTRPCGRRRRRRRSPVGEPQPPGLLAVR